METSLRALEPAWLDLQTRLVSRGEQSRDCQATGVRACHGRTNNGYVLDLPVTIDLPTHILEPEPISPSSSQASPQPQTGELAAELTPDAALVQPIAELSLPEDLSDSETTVTKVSPRRRASVATETAEAAFSDATKERIRRSSAQ